MAIASLVAIAGAAVLGRRSAAALIDSALREAALDDSARSEALMSEAPLGEAVDATGPLGTSLAPAHPHRPSLSILVPARDEAHVLPNLIRDLAAQRHRRPDGCPDFEVVVIDDASVDGSGRAARHAADAAGIGDAVRVVRSRAETKGGALADVPLAELSSPAILVLDADARLPPDFLGRIATLAETHRALTVRRRTLAKPGDVWSATQDDEQTLDGALQALRTSLGAAPELRGNGMLLHRDALEAVGGWPVAALTEDLELSTRLLAAGITIGWAAAPSIWEDAAPDARSFARQRLRWAEGSLRRILATDPGRLSRAPVPTAARLDALASWLQAVVPTTIVGVFAGSLAARRPSRSAGLALALASATALVIDPVLSAATGLDNGDVRPGGRAPHEGAAAPRARRLDRLARTLRLTVYLGHWLPSVVVALARIAVVPSVGPYRRTPHLGAAAPPWEAPRASSRDG